MLGISKEIAEVAQQEPSPERLKALKKIIPTSTIRSILKSAQKSSRLPKEFMVWLVVGMGLFATDSYRQIFRWLTRFRKNSIPGRSTFCEARQRLGVAPLLAVFTKVVKLLATPFTKGAFYQGMRLMAIDGFVVDLPDTDENERVFGRPKNGKSKGAFPQARVLALCEVGTHVLWKYMVRPIRWAEIRMAKALLRVLEPDMLLLWDRGFLSFDNVMEVLTCKANLLGRVKKNRLFKKFKVLADGSYLTKIYKSQHDRLKDRNGVEVRLIEYTIEDSTRCKPGQVHRLLTTLRDAKEHPAKRLVELYHERWEEEIAIGELKTHQKQRPVLRSQRPMGVLQEICGMLLAHYVVRSLMNEAAQNEGVAPRRISFVGALKIVRCRLPECPRSRAGQKGWYERLIEEIGEEILPQRRNRINPRVIKRKISKWPKKRKKHRQTPQPTEEFTDVIEVVN